MSTNLYTLCVDNYAPEIRALTEPLLQAYARKIRARFIVIDERKHPDRPPVFEKFQIPELAAQHPADWHFFLDLDTLVHPDMLDPTLFLRKDEVMHFNFDMSNLRFAPSKYMLRDGRHLGSCTWWCIASDWNVDDFWRKPDRPTAEIIENIQTTVDEKLAGITQDHLIDDYTLTQNVARFGLHVANIGEVCRRSNLLQGLPDYIWHQYTMPVEQKVVEMKKKLREWKLL